MVARKKFVGDRCQLLRSRKSEKGESVRFSRGPNGCCQCSHWHLLYQRFSRRILLCHLCSWNQYSILLHGLVISSNSTYLLSLPQKIILTHVNRGSHHEEQDRIFATAVYSRLFRLDGTWKFGILFCERNRFAPLRRHMPSTASIINMTTTKAQTADKDSEDRHVCRHPFRLFHCLSC
jgi:hypothetical protein